MTMEQLRIFVAVAERQHVTRAAGALNLAQPVVNAAIAALEKRRGAKLFHRVGGAIQLSDAGSLFLREARALLARADATQKPPAGPGMPERGLLRIQASETIASHFLPRHLVAFRRAHKQIDIRLATGNTAQVAAAIRAGEVDLGFTEGETGDPDLTTECVARDGTIVVAGRAHPWCQSADVGARDFMDAEWVLREPGSGTRAAFEAAMQAVGVPPADLRVAMELPSDEAVRAAVEAGMGAAAMSASLAARGLEAGLLHHVPFDLPDRTFHAVRKGSGVGEELIEMVKGK